MNGNAIRSAGTAILGTNKRKSGSQSLGQSTLFTPTLLEMEARTREPNLDPVQLCVSSKKASIWIYVRPGMMLP